ncbi:MAG TPA: Hint domain-containing protein, partial [Tepidisphaeraceae bacterium]|nr:Hint domain-containing protein [Tepidisphaeraceae bacterium]
MRTFHVILAALTLLISATLALARGGGGCFEAGTPVLTPCGPRAIEQLKPGDAVFSVVANQLCAARVSSCQQVTPAQYIEIQLDDRRLHVTAEHPFETSRGTFVEAHDLHAGDEIECVERDVAHARRIASVRIVAAVHPAYNLLVTPGGTFVADGAVVHNKGCFLPDTPILRADGSEAPIASIKPGDELLAFSEDGTPTHAIVRDIITHDVDE